MGSAVRVPEVYWSQLPKPLQDAVKAMRKNGWERITVGDARGERLKSNQQEFHSLSVMGRRGGVVLALFWRRTPKGWVADGSWISQGHGLEVGNMTDGKKAIKA